MLPIRALASRSDEARSSSTVSTEAPLIRTSLTRSQGDQRSFKYATVMLGSRASLLGSRNA
jgi:hypothetical protein